MAGFSWAEFSAAAIRQETRSSAAHRNEHAQIPECRSKRYKL